MSLLSEMRKDDRRQAVRRHQEAEENGVNALVELRIGKYKLRITSVAGGLILLTLVLTGFLGVFAFLEMKTNRIDRVQTEASANITLKEHADDLVNHDTSSVKNHSDLITELRQLGWITCVSHTRSTKMCLELGVMQPAGRLKSKFNGQGISMLPTSAEAAERGSK